MGQARRLAAWVGEGRRSVTAGLVLRRPEAAAAGGALGIAMPAKVRTAADVPALHWPWSLAVAVGLLKVRDGTVTAGAALRQWPAVDDATVLIGWLAGLCAACRAESDRRHEDSVEVLVFALLRVLATQAPPAGEALLLAVWAAIRDGSRRRWPASTATPCWSRSRWRSSATVRSAARLRDFVRDPSAVLGPPSAGCATGRWCGRAPSPTRYG